jgi:hypothetical protein
MPPPPHRAQLGSEPRRCRSPDAGRASGEAWAGQVLVGLGPLSQGRRATRPTTTCAGHADDQRHEDAAATAATSHTTGSAVRDGDGTQIPAAADGPSRGGRRAPPRASNHQGSTGAHRSRAASCGRWRELDAPLGNPWRTFMTMPNHEQKNTIGLGHCAVEPCRKVREPPGSAAALWRRWLGFAVGLAQSYPLRACAVLGRA